MTNSLFMTNNNDYIHPFSVPYPPLVPLPLAALKPRLFEHLLTSFGSAASGNSWAPFPSFCLKNFLSQFLLRIGNLVHVKWI